MCLTPGDAAVYSMSLEKNSIVGLLPLWGLKVPGNFNVSSGKYENILDLFFHYIPFW